MSRFTDRDDDDGDFSVSPWTWFAKGEWQALSDEQQARYDGDISLMR